MSTKPSYLLAAALASLLLSGCGSPTLRWATPTEQGAGTEIYLYGTNALTTDEYVTVITAFTLNLRAAVIEDTGLSDVPIRPGHRPSLAVYYSEEEPPSEYATEYGPLGLAWYGRGVAVIYLSRVNPRLPWAVANITMHEVGHLLGMEHSGDCEYVLDCLSCSDCMTAHIPLSCFVTPCTLSRIPASGVSRSEGEP